MSFSVMILFFEFSKSESYRIKLMPDKIRFLASSVIIGVRLIRRIFEFKNLSVFKWEINIYLI